MENAEVGRISKIASLFNNWSFWQKILSLVILPTVISLLTYYLIVTGIYWFAVVTFIIGIIYFMVALMLNNSDKDFEVKLPGSWLSITKHEQ